MVVSKEKDAKRKRKESPIIESSPEMPKRTKVQAQRKFAQGQHAPTSSSYTFPNTATVSTSGAATTSQSAIASSSMREPPPELITKRPNPEDFLTFLCFRGTPVLPTKLDFLNQNKNPVKKKDNNTSNELLDKKNKTSPQTRASTSKSNAISTQTETLTIPATHKLDTVSPNPDNINNPDTKDNSKAQKKNEIIPFAVRKRAEQTTEGNKNVQNKKTKNKNSGSGTVIGPATGSGGTVTTNSSPPTVTLSIIKEKDEAGRRSMRTRGKTSLEPDFVAEDGSENNESEMKTEKSTTTTTAKGDIVAKEKPSTLKGKRKSGGGKSVAQEICDEKCTIESETVDKSASRIPRRQPLKPKSSKSSKTTITEEAKSSVIVKELTPIPPPEPEPEPVGRMTRQRAFFEPVKVPPKPEIIEIVKPVELKESVLEHGKSTNKSAKEEAIDFSSDDEQPLAKTIKVIKKQKKSPIKNKQKLIKPPLDKLNSDNIEVPTRLIPSVAIVVTSDISEIERKPTLKKVTSKTVDTSKSLQGPKTTKPESQVILSKDDRNSAGGKATIAPILKDAEAQCDQQVFDDSKILKPSPKKNTKATKNDSEDGSFGKTTTVLEPKKKARKKGADADISQQSQTDISETDIKTGRPTRKTKEAATIYMELIGQKLNLGEFDEDDFSMDSFPELPNVKETQKMETELKKNVGKVKLPVIAETEKGTEDILGKDESLSPGLIRKKRGPKKKPLGGIKKAVGAKKKANTEIKRKLEKSFSDSDDEPLAVKLTKTSEKDFDLPQIPTNSSFRSPISATASVTKKPIENQFPPGNHHPDSVQNITEVNKVLSASKQMKLSSSPNVAATKSQLKPPPNSPQLISPVSHNTPKHRQTPSPAGVVFTPLETYPSPKINPTFLTPKFDRNMERRPPVASNDAQKNLSFPSPSAQASITPAAKHDSNTNTPKSTSPSNNSSANAIANILATNLMPSKEESGKIFGIASVSLAQSSGPDNTKCTLGKCGSVHKPVLGPVVPTESYLGEQQLSSKERRKAKVNMTHEQIQKWLLECSVCPDVIIDDLDEDSDEILKPTTFSPTPPPPNPLKDDKESTSTSSKTTKQELSKAESAWSGKGPSLKATPVVAKEEASNYTESPIQELIAKKDEDLTPPPPRPSKTRRPARRPKKKLIRDTKPKGKVEETDIIVAASSSKSTITPAKKSIRNPTPSTKSLAKQQKEEPADNKKDEPIPSTPSPQPLKTTPKRTPVYSAKPATPTENKRNRLPAPKSGPNQTFSAFSPDNEKSVYSFDKEDDELPPPLLPTKPFRRHSRRDSHNDDQNQTEAKPSNSNKQDKIIETNGISLTVNPDDNRKLVKMNIDSNTATESVQPKKFGKKGTKVSDDKAVTNEFVSNDSEGETFYIPLEGASVSGKSGVKSDLVQAVEVRVKVGREGPDGPNQRLCVQATLVTKSQMGTTNSTTTAHNTTMTTTTVIDSSDMNKKDSPTTATGIVASNSKSVPIGTVTPRFKSSNPSDQQPSVPNQSGSVLQRVNSNSSLFSGSQKSRAGGGAPNNNMPINSKKHKDDVAIKMCNNTAFPRHDDPSQMVEAPVFRPTEKEFNDPMEFIERITPIAARFGICKIIPPANFKPECRVSDDMRFSAYNQYVHKMLHRWGPSVKEFHAIKKHCGTQQVSLTPFPLIGQMEVDLPRLYHTVQELGGLQEVMEKKKWTRVADEMCIPKLAQDRATRLDDIYCKYLLPYDTLSTSERQKLFDEVEADWAKREARARRNADHCLNSDSDSNEDEEDDVESSEDSEEEDADGVSMECIVKGKSMPLKQFFRIARNTMSLWFKNDEPTVANVEAEFWRHVAVRDSHVCVHSGSIDSSGWGYGFPSPGPKGKGSPCAKHPWNLKVLTNNPGSVLRSLGPVMGVTVPTLHVGMLFSACCWYRDPHGLSWIEYLHTGANKIWYGIPDEQSSNFRSALTALIPTHCQNKTIWLPCDTAMVPPHMLTDRGVSLCRIEQKPGEFVVIFPRAYTSSLSSGYVVSESVYFATSSWLDLAKEDFRDIHDSCEPAMFSLEQLLFAVASDQRVTADILVQCLPMINEVFEKEQAAREQLKATGVKSIEKLLTDKANKSKKKPAIPQFTDDDNECDLCRANLYISMVKTNDGNNTYCLQHALKNLNKGNILADQCKLIFTYGIEDIEELIKKLKERLAHKTKSTFPFSSSSGAIVGGSGGGVGTSKKK